MLFILANKFTDSEIWDFKEFRQESYILSEGIAIPSKPNFDLPFLACTDLEIGFIDPL